MSDTPLTQQQIDVCNDNQTDFSDLRAIYFNCSLTPSPGDSHTQRLMDLSIAILEANKVACETIRVADFDLPPGVQPDMTEHGYAKDDWPMLFEKVMKANIVVIGTPIWLGEKSSICTRLIERLYGNSGQTNDAGQYVYYGRVGGCVITGNEDGAKHCATEILYGMSHLGLTIPPQADCYWVGEAGPGPSYGDERDDGTRAGYGREFTRRNTTFMSWNLMHLARMIKDAGGIPAHGNSRTEWKAGCKADAPNPEHR